MGTDEAVETPDRRRHGKREDTTTTLDTPRSLNKTGQDSTKAGAEKEVGGGAVSEVESESRAEGVSACDDCTDAFQFSHLIFGPFVQGFLKTTPRVANLRFRPVWCGWILCSLCICVVLMSRVTLALCSARVGRGVGGAWLIRLHFRRAAWSWFRRAAAAWPRSPVPGTPDDVCPKPGWLGAATAPAKILCSAVVCRER